MSLTKKTFLYSILLAVIMVASVTGYFVFMLPSLYVDYVKRSNLESAVEIQQGYMEKRSYDNLVVKNPSAAVSVEIPREGDTIFAAGKFFRLTVEVRDEELREFLGELRKRIGNRKAAQGYVLENDFSQEGDVSQESISAFWALWGEKLRDKFADREKGDGEYPLRIRAQARQEQGIYREEYTKTHITASGILVYEMGVSDGDYGYTTYIAAGQTEDAFIITILPTMTPRMAEITPIVMESLPMIVAVVFLIVLIAARFFSGKIVRPIIRLAGYAQNARLTERFEGGFAQGEGAGADDGDEIAALGKGLRELYDRLRESYRELEEKNRFLEEENVRKEVFLRASSHQLKTPVAAALLLVEGMMNEVGKYKDTRTYLPEVKRQLLSMRKIIEDTLHTLYLGSQGKDAKEETVAVEGLIQELLGAYRIQSEARRLLIVSRGCAGIRTNGEMLKKILDNLLSNAVQYTPEGGKIEIEASPGEVRITNYGILVDEKLLPGIFDPFVSSDAAGKGRGLGLYVAAYYSRLLGYELTVVNGENFVQAKVLFSPMAGRCEASDPCFERKEGG